MIFYIIECKAHDLYTIYDVENGGVCCCSLYTIKQLQDMGHTVKGYSVVNGRAKVIELDLAGNPRSKKAPVVCKDETKRSAVTIARGLSESKYPREKQTRDRVRNIFKRGSLSKLTFADGTSCIGIATTRNSIYAAAMNTFYSEAALLKRKVICVPYTPKTDEEKRLYIEALEHADAFQASSAKLREVREQYEALGKQVDALEKERQHADFILRNYRDTVINAVDIGIRLEAVKGDECFKMSSVSTKHGALPFDSLWLKRVLSLTKRKIIYTYGLEMRNPTTHKKPISLADALKIVEKGGWMDIDATKDYIHINEFSDTDMW